jgi:hypothetical protein
VWGGWGGHRQGRERLGEGGPLRLHQGRRVHVQPGRDDQLEQKLATDVAQVRHRLAQPAGQALAAPPGGPVHLPGWTALARLLAPGLDQAQRGQPFQGAVHELAGHTPHRAQVGLRGQLRRDVVAVAWMHREARQHRPLVQRKRVPAIHTPDLLTARD